MRKERLEAFSDGVVAVLITIMVLEFHAATAVDLAALGTLGPSLLAYVLSFVTIGIYWTNHHHLLQAADRVDGRVLWANLHLLFWLSLFPFATAWMGERGFAPIPTAVYGGVALFAAIAYTLLVRALLVVSGQARTVAATSGGGRQGQASLAMYAIGMVVALVLPVAALALYVAVAVIWFLPERRIERALIP